MSTRSYSQQGKWAAFASPAFKSSAYDCERYRRRGGESKKAIRRQSGYAYQHKLHKGSYQC
ncbi:hypothetical protein [Klebsiella phage vB_KshKPC-M]|nr:hypothetical protein [Klebsiella phage vB_KshKPC-M]